MKKMFFALIFLCISLPVAAQLTDINARQFREKNPDGRKYEFIRDYIEALSYIYEVEQRSDRLQQLLSGPIEDQKIVARIIDDLIQNNMSLRIARNYIGRYVSPENGLMLKTADLFTNMCNTLIEFNNHERKILAGLYGEGLQGANNKKRLKEYIKELDALSLQRREVHTQLLEASIFASKVVVSDKPDYRGEFDKLGMTAVQREKLVEQLNNLFESMPDKEVKDGQSFIEASVATLRNILEDTYRWGTQGG